MRNRGLQATNRVMGWVEYVRSETEEISITPDRSAENQSRVNHKCLIDISELPYLGHYSDIVDEDGTDGRGYQQLLADARLGKFSHIAIAYVHVFGQTDAEIREAFDTLIALGITIRIASYPILAPEEPDERLLIDMLLDFAQQIAADCSKRFHQRLKQQQQHRFSAN